MSECVRVIGEVETTGKNRSSPIEENTVTVPLRPLRSPHELA